MATFQIFDLTGAIWLMQDKLLLKTEKRYNVIINEKPSVSRCEVRKDFEKSKALEDETLR